jgi:hypothetical protein
MFAAALREQRRLSPTVLRWRLDPAAEPVARDLTTRETACCSFFTFTFTSSGDDVVVDVTVPEEYTGVLDGLADQAASRAAGMCAPHSRAAS